VNGTAVFAEMFEGAGHRVSSWTSLSPRLDQADCVVWFPNDFQPPSPEVVAWFERWLRAKPQRTLIYVGRDFDATPWYWRKMQAAAPASQRKAIADLRAEAERAFQSARPSEQATAECPWFMVRYDVPAGTAHNVTGDPEWMQDLDPAQMEVELNSRMSPPLSDAAAIWWSSSPPRMHALLKSDEGLILGQRDVGQSRLLVVANGSFLLNATLVNHEHRKLAGKLVDTIGPSGQDVVFLESGRVKIDPSTSPAMAPWPTIDPGPGDGGARRTKQPDESDNGPPIRPVDLLPAPPTGLDMLLVWPTNWILLHFALIGILFCFWKLPIFGLPRPEDPARPSDFGRHIDAVAALLRRTADRRYALSRVKHYQQVVKN
jgi:hypothetical protein